MRIYVKRSMTGQGYFKRPDFQIIKLLLLLFFL